MNNSNIKTAIFWVVIIMVVVLFWTMLLVLPLLILAGVIAFFVFRPQITHFGPRRF